MAVKRIYILKPFLILCASYSLKGTDHINELKNIAKDPFNPIAIKWNADDTLQTQITNRTRALAFTALRKKYLSSDAREITNEDIISLKKDLINKNKINKLTHIEDLNNCLKNYNDIYLKQRNEPNNIYFLETIIPILFVNKDFSKIENEPQLSYTMPGSLLVCGRQNPYLIRCLFYIGNIMFKNRNDESLPYSPLLHLLNSLNEGGFIFNGSLNTEPTEQSKIEYIKAIFTPPTLLVNNIKRDILPKIKTFLLCLNHCKKKSFYYKVAKPVLQQLIFYHFIKYSISEKMHKQCDRVTQNAHEQIEVIKNLNALCSKKKDPLMGNFLSYGFNQWAQKNMDIAWVTLQDMVFKK